MRVFMLVLAIVLLPLRGWMGDAMMLAPVQQAIAAPATHGVHAHERSPEAHAHGTTGDAAADVDHGAMHHGDSSPHPHATCDTCQFCHSVAVTAWPEVPMPPEAPRHAPAAETVIFASAEAAPGFKPPIS